MGHRRPHRDDWEDLLPEGLAAIPDMAALINEEARVIISEGGLLLAYDLDHQSDGFVSNVNVLSTELVRRMYPS